MNNVYVCMQGPGVLFRSALTVCFSFAAGSTEARLKLDPVDIPVAWMFGLQGTSSTHNEHAHIYFITISSQSSFDCLLTFIKDYWSFVFAFFVFVLRLRMRKVCFRPM